jgi:hypothetical protein
LTATALDLDAAVSIPIRRGIKIGHEAAMWAVERGFALFVGVNFQHGLP